jgi:hypothetical protein
MYCWVDGEIAKLHVVYICWDNDILAKTFFVLEWKEERRKIYNYSWKVKWTL